MTIAVIGTGFVGVVTSAVMAKFGHLVYGLDIDVSKVEKLNQGVVPFYEPGLKELVNKGLKNNKLKFTTDYQEAIPEADVIMIAVGTPSAKNGTADLKFVLGAAKEAAKYIKPGAILALKSTVPPGTNNKVKEAMSEETQVEFFVVSLPEFLKEGSAVEDTLNPHRVVIGAENEDVIEKLFELHKPLGGKRVVISAESAQMAKYTANAYLAQRITFINQVANLCEINGAHIGEVIEAIGLDERIGNHYWYPGLGYGGSCFPKDVKELAAYARSQGEADSLLVKIDELNDQRMMSKLDEFDDLVGGFEGKTVAVLGLSFKPNTNDMRVAPSLTIVPYLKNKGAVIKAYDPKVVDEAEAILGKIFLASDPYEAIQDADIVMLLVEWDELISLDAEKVYQLMKEPRWFIDTRNQYNPKKMNRLGFKYLGIGNP